LTLPRSSPNFFGVTIFTAGIAVASTRIVRNISRLPDPRPAGASLPEASGRSHLIFGSGPEASSSIVNSAKVIVHNGCRSYFCQLSGKIWFRSKNHFQVLL